MGDTWRSVRTGNSGLVRAGIALVVLSAGLALLGELVGGRGRRESPVALEGDPGSRGRHVLNRVRNSELMHRSDENFKDWHQGHYSLQCCLYAGLQI